MAVLGEPVGPVTHPAARDPDRGLGVDSLVPAQIQAGKQENKAVCGGSCAQEDLHAGSERLSREFDKNLLGAHQPTKRTSVFLEQLESHPA
ncbi:MAG: hypothetical protein OXC19_17475 [Bryobacterales bacterium]|nr:hypothetical protein [Bryobacterales bacterium]